MTIEQALELAVSHHTAGRLDEAAQIYQTVLRAQPQNQTANYNLGVLLSQAGRHDQAIQPLQMAIRARPGADHYWLTYAFALRKVGKLREAAFAFATVLVINPSKAEALNDLGTMHMEKERWAWAAAFIGRAATLSQNVPDIWMSYATCLDQLGRIDDAEIAAEKALALDPGDRLSVPLFLAKLGRAPIPDRASPAFIKATYDGKANAWGTPQGNRRYLGADLVAGALCQVARDSLDVLDAGCGNGLVGELIKDVARSLDGIDLSAKMIEAAKRKEIYTSLQQADLLEYLETHSDSYDAIACAATLIHFGDLSTALSAAFRCLRRNGVLIFTVFRGEDPDGFAVRSAVGYAQGGIFEHGQTYVTKMAENAGFAVETTDVAPHEYSASGAPQMALVVTLRKP